MNKNKEIQNKRKSNADKYKIVYQDNKNLQYYVL